MSGTADSSTVLLEVEDLVVKFPLRSGMLPGRRQAVQAVSGVSFAIRRGETLGLVGESGCGKSTVARAIAGLQRPTSGKISFEGRQRSSSSAHQRRLLAQEIQFIFQDPYDSLNPRMTVRQHVIEPWRIHRGFLGRDQWQSELARLLQMVGLNMGQADHYPRQLSGGQRQRACIARALALRPKLVICDEAVSALDVSIQAQVVNLLRDLQQELGISYLFISHDLAVVRHLCDRLAVMYLGKIVEEGERGSLYETPMHPYTQALLSSAPIIDPWSTVSRREILLPDEMPSSTAPPTGCRFRTRCWKATERCANEEPHLEGRAGRHLSACHFAEAATGLVPP